MSSEAASPSPAAPVDLTDQEIKRLAAGGGINIMGLAVNQACQFGVTILLARWLGPADIGTYAQAFAVRQLLLLLALGGMRSAMTRYVAIHRADDDPAALRGTVRFGLTVTTVISVVTGVVLFAAAPWLANEAFDDPALEFALRWVAVGLPAACLLVATLSATQGFRTQRPFAFVGNILEPGLRLGLTVGVVALGAGVDGAVVVMQVATVVALVVAYLWLRRLVARHPRVTPRYEVRSILRFASVSWLASLAQQGLVWADIVMIGLFLTAADVGVYQVATRIVLIGAIATHALNASLAPRAADLFRRGERQTLERLYVASSEWLVRLTLPLLAFLFVCAEPVLRLFGEEFVIGVTVTRILIVGVLIDAATTQGGILLNMSGHNTLNMLDSVAALALNIGLNIVLIPAFGINGASVSWAASLFIIGTLRAWQVRHVVVDVYPLSWRVLKSAGAAVVAIAIGWPLFTALPPAWGFLVVVVAMVVVYFGALAALGVEDDDRMVLRSLMARLRPSRAPAGRSA